MASVSRLNGFQAKKSLVASWNGQSNMYFVPSTDATVIMVGDLVKLAGSARGPLGCPTVTRAVAGDATVGVVVGIPFSGVGDVTNMPPVNDLNPPVYRRASTDRYLMVLDDPNLIFEVQASANTIANTDVGMNANFRATAGNTTTGASGMDLDVATIAATATLPLKIMGFPPRADNVVGTDAFISVWVKINNHQYAGGTGTLGV